ncbi:uncharacterized protein LOC142490730 [Ascaphus truei]|uniref:uncharacterized protein LOC142490730 n=1 Tax=Ascaphus truei TaxID=8439 RepID=UPI003F5A8EFD
MTTLIVRDRDQVPKPTGAQLVFNVGSFAENDRNPGRITNKVFFQGHIVTRMVKYFRHDFPSGGHRFYQDNDPKHTTSNLKLIELVWHALKDHKRKVVKPSNIEELVKGTKSFWNDILTVQKCSSYINNISSILPIVLECNGNATSMLKVAPGGHVSPEMEQVSSPGSASSTLLEEHHGDEDDEYDEDDATEETEIQSCDHEEVPIETVVPPNRPSTSTYDAIVASEGKIVDAENRRHSDMMTVLERMIGLQEETVSQLAHLHRVFIEVPKQLQKINTSFEALVVQQTQANYWRMTNVPQFNTSQPGSVHAGQFSPHSSEIHSPGPNVTGQVADIAVQVPDDILPLPSLQIQQQTPTKEPLTYTP